MKGIKIFSLIICLLFNIQGVSGQPWVSLFDGKTFKGWKKMHDGLSEFVIKNGELIGITKDKTITSHIATTQEYDDFILEMDVYIDEGLNSGIDFRSSLLPENKISAYQIDVDGWPRKWSGGLYEENGRGWIGIPEANPNAKDALKVNHWNKFRIEAIGSEIRVWINKIPIAVYIDDSKSKGFITLQIHHAMKPEDENKMVKWRNMKIQTANLTFSKIAASVPIINLTDKLSNPEIIQGFISLQNATNFEAWRSVHSTAAPNKRWKNINGVYSLDKSDGSETGNDILTEKHYGAFELCFDFKLTDGANSGLKYFVDEKYDSSGKSGIGLEYQILDDVKHPDAKQGALGNRTLASLYDLIPSIKPASQFSKKIGEWNKGRVVVTPDNWVQHWLNGFKVVEYERNSNIFKALVARSKYAGYNGFASAPKGHILLQDHGDAVEFKNIKIREIK